MIQFNLLPDVKQEYIKTQRLKRLVIGVSLALSALVMVVFLVLIFSVYVVQKGNINNINHEIQTNSDTLKNTPNLSTILTVQGQLTSLASLDSQNPAASRLFEYLSQLVPTSTTISDLQINFTQDNMTITGNAPSLAVVTNFVDNLKYTAYTISGESGSHSAFSSVILASFGLSPTGASYSITLNFDPTLFNNANTVSLSVGGNPPPAAAQQPSIIFEKGN
jgi:Tfp pilus assembly protein PilN